MKPPCETLGLAHINIATLTPKIMAAIAERVMPERIGDAILELLDANMANDKPDWRAREAGIKLYLSYMVGMPTQRIEETVTRVNVSLDPEKMLSNPATLEAIARKLRGTEAGTRLLDALSSQPKQAQGTVVETDEQ